MQDIYEKSVRSTGHAKPSRLIARARWNHGDRALEEDFCGRNYEHMSGIITRVWKVDGDVLVVTLC